MEMRVKKLRDIYNKAFDLGLDCDASQMRTTLQMRSLLIKQHISNLAEIDDWLRNQERNLNRRIQEIERGEHE